MCHLTKRPIEVRLMLSSWFCRPKLPATSTTIWRQVQGMVGRKSVTTNCRHWKAVRINDSLKEYQTQHIAFTEFDFRYLRRSHTINIGIQTISVSTILVKHRLLCPPPTGNFLPLIIADCSYDTQDEGPARPQAVSVALKNLQDTFQLFLPDVCMEHVGQLLQGVKQQKLQALGDKKKKGEIITDLLNDRGL